MKNLGKILMPLALVALLAGCEDDKADYIKLSLSSFTFSADGSEELVVTVVAAGSWTFDYDQSWVTAEAEDARTLRIGATPTMSSSMRKARLTITSGNAEEVIDLSQLGTSVLFNMLEQHSQEYVISQYGKYIGGVEVDLVNSVYYYTPYIIEVQSGEKRMFPTTTEMYDAEAIADNGLFVVKEFNSSSQFYAPDGVLTDVKIPAGYQEAVVCQTSSDGTVFVGYARNITDRLYYPVKWVDNEPVILDMPSLATDGTPVTQGTMARGCSADGSVIYGSCWDDYTGVYWKGNGPWQYVGGESAIDKHTLIVDIGGGSYYEIQVVDRPIFLNDRSNISSSGRYLATTYQVTVAQNRQDVPYNYPALFDTETGEFTVLRTLPDGFTSGWGWTATDNGRLSFSCPRGETFIGYVYDSVTGSVRSTSDFLAQEYGMMLKQEEIYVRSFAGNGETLLGGTYLFGGSSMQYWYLTMID